MYSSGADYRRYLFEQANASTEELIQVAQGLDKTPRFVKALGFLGFSSGLEARVDALGIWLQQKSILRA